jgi:hypothetical protein
VVTVTAARLRLVDIDVDLGDPPLLGAAARAGRAEEVARRKLEVTGPDGLEWLVRRLVLPLAMRPHPPSEQLALAHPANEVAAALPLGYVLVPLVLPFLPVVLLLRALRVLPWTLEARTYPWGRRFPPMVLAYQVRGREEAEAACREIAAGLARGDGAPVVPGAERVR